MRADQKIGTCTADNLFIDGKFPVDAVSVTITSGEGTLARGTVVSMSDKTKKCVILGTTAGTGETLTPYGIICDDVDATSADAVAMVYRSGHFNREALIADDDYTITEADEAKLRNGGIYLDSAM
ncbi:head decoration protein [Lacrimispora defluvii]|uniref:Head decoration protein n=1 Tax=Lacrimispora defluvii TaxID=2719233 RepID=A0ABX1VS33_9FIRM|nr:head decoration protein [Lacrimispora defluvii]NNJ30096.1 head decoration protein [Lacrimispora defluvii]